MAYAATLHDFAAPTPGFFARFRAGYAAYRTFLTTRNELQALTDRELADLGISRHNIGDIAREAAYAA